MKVNSTFSDLWGMVDIKQDCIPELCQVEVAGSVV